MFLLDLSFIFAVFKFIHIFANQIHKDTEMHVVIVK